MPDGALLWGGSEILKKQALRGSRILKNHNLRIVLPDNENNIRKIAIPPDDVYISNVRPPGPPRIALLEGWRKLFVGVLP
ncbi:MAG TPA: hypothetical protein DCR97_00805 [Deltaproteobacteria bacterium]|nr:hypothetical protein [Deltaproteobacteria bacterium]